MPKSRHRKNQKKKSRARSEKVQSAQRVLRQKMQDEFEKEMEKAKNKKFGIEEVDSSNTPENSGEVNFEEIKG
tara:strand:- start:672 stop:890 length:219 start_codon:yes stop_codon:yes gene_type:complete